MEFRILGPVAVCACASMSGMPQAAAFRGWAVPSGTSPRCRVVMASRVTAAVAAMSPTGTGDGQEEAPKHQASPHRYPPLWRFVASNTGRLCHRFTHRPDKA